MIIEILAFSLLALVGIASVIGNWGLSGYREKVNGQWRYNFEN